MTDELKLLKQHIESSIISERNHIFKYTAPLTNHQSTQAKTVFLEYERATSKARCHNYNVQSLSYGDIQVKEKHIPSLYEFLTKKLRFHFTQDRKSYVSDKISASFTVYDEDGSVEDRLIDQFDFIGETDSKIFNSWLLLAHLFEISEQIAKAIETKNFLGINSYLNMIDNNFDFLMDSKNSYFQLNMDEEELYSWVLSEIKSFKHQVEEKGLWKSLNKEPEKHFQQVFAAVIGRISELFGVDMSPEPDLGSGKVDFKFSQGSNSKICVELKLSTSSKALEGYTEQLKQYLISAKTNKGIYVVIDSGDARSSYTKLLDFIEDGKKNGQSYPDIVLIDSRQKKSASKLG